jgi:hypothetical protein
MHITVSWRLSKDGCVAQHTVVQCTLCLEKVSVNLNLLRQCKLCLQQDCNYLSGKENNTPCYILVYSKMRCDIAILHSTQTSFSSLSWKAVPHHIHRNKVTVSSIFFSIGELQLQEFIIIFQLPYQNLTPARITYLLWRGYRWFSFQSLVSKV